MGYAAFPFADSLEGYPQILGQYFLGNIFLPAQFFDFASYVEFHFRPPVLSVVFRWEFAAHPYSRGIVPPVS